MKLATKLIILLLLLTTIPLAVVGYLAYDNGRRTIEQNVLNHLISTNILKQDEFDRWVRGNERSLRDLARRPLVREYAATLASYDPDYPEYQAAYVSLIEDHLSPTLEEEGGFLDLSILRGDDGWILISTAKNLEGKYRESEPFFVEGRNRTYVENVSYSLSLGEVVMHISTPIVDREGHLIAVLAGHADLGEMSGIMEQRSGLSSSEDTYLVNAFNFFVTEPLFGEDYALKKAVRTEGVEACLDHNDGVGFYDDYRGVPVIGAYRWLEERELCILTEVDQAEAYAPIVALRNIVLGIAVGVALIVALLGMLFAYTITGPVRQLVVGAEEIGRGNLDYRIEVGARDEIGQLSQAFNQMTENLQAITASRDELNREIAERQRVEESLKEYSERLEEMVEERTKELREAQEQLVRREKLAVLGQLAGGVGHELRNPLGVISNAVYFLQMTLSEADEITKEYLGIISSEVRNSTKIVSDLLDFARTRPAEREEIAVSALVTQVLEKQPPPEGVEVTTQIAPDLPAVYVDPRQIGQVLTNLVTNAYQAMPEGGRLMISVSEDEGIGRRGDKETRRQGDSLPVSPSPCLRVSISDTGCGISEENMEKMFEPLFTTKAKGIGLGLAVSKNLVEANGGSIEVEIPSTELGTGPSTELGTGPSTGLPSATLGTGRAGEVGKGSTFTVRLPLAG